MPKPAPTLKEYSDSLGTSMKSKIIVQHSRTGAYIGCEDQQRWTDNALMARLFETTYHALYFCVDKKLKNANILFRFSNGQEKHFLQC